MSQLKMLIILLSICFACSEQNNTPYSLIIIPSESEELTNSLKVLFEDCYIIEDNTLVLPKCVSIVDNKMSFIKESTCLQIQINSYFSQINNNDIINGSIDIHFGDCPFWSYQSPKESVGSNICVQLNLKWSEFKKEWEAWHSYNGDGKYKLVGKLRK